MTNRRAKIAAGATVAGLAALGGVALGSNQGMPSPSAVQQGEAGATASIVTGASGATAATTVSTAANGTAKQAPIVTRASGGGTAHDD